ncbi:hypothetical protein AAC387_Pa03g2586 [Persea americana]
MWAHLGCTKAIDITCNEAAVVFNIRWKLNPCREYLNGLPTTGRISRHIRSAVTRFKKEKNQKIKQSTEMIPTHEDLCRSGGKCGGESFSMERPHFPLPLPISSFKSKT